MSLVAQMVKEPACNVGDPRSIPGLGRSPGERNGNPLQYSCLENSVGRGAWRAVVYGVAKSQTRLSDSHLHLFPPPKQMHQSRVFHNAWFLIHTQ